MCSISKPTTGRKKCSEVEVRTNELKAPSCEGFLTLDLMTSAPMYWQSFPKDFGVLGSILHPGKQNVDRGGQPSKGCCSAWLLCCGLETLSFNTASIPKVSRFIKLND